MDKLANELKVDAEMIDVQVSDELDRRIMASLHGAQPEKPAVPVVRQRPRGFWWASSLTGVAAALIVIAVFNAQSRLDMGTQPLAEAAPDMSPVAVVVTPVIDWKTESAMLTRPLQQELEDLQADIKKAEEKVKQDIGL